MVKKAVVLIAGLGSRLKPLTDHVPKCMVQVKGKPILVNTLENLEKHGIQEVVLVVGHHSRVIAASLGDSFHGMNITYITNELYKDTNSMYSLWLAREHLKEGTLIIEGDSIAEEEIIKRAIQFDSSKSCWMLDQFTENQDGSMSIIDEQTGQITELRIVREKLAEYKKNYLKSVGIVKVHAEYGKLLAQWLDDDVKAGNTNIYYDLVIAKHLNDFPLYANQIQGLRWFEIDNFEDLKRAEKIFHGGFGMKYVIVISDGMADLPLPQLDKTPVEVAETPNMDFIAKQGRTGLMKTCFDGLPLGSIVANMGILGFNPLQHYPSGRASFEALAQGIYLGKNDIAFRCNLVTVKDNILTDFTSEMISNDHALKLVSGTHLPEGVELYTGLSYRNTLVIRNAPFKASDIVMSEPHMNIGKNIQEIMPKAKTPEAEAKLAVLKEFMHDSLRQVEELNKVHDTKASMFWLWSPSSPPDIPSFTSLFNIKGGIVSGMDFLRGIGSCAKMHAKEVPGATGYIDTNLKEKLKYAKNLLMYNDLVYVHVNAPDEESHAKNAKNKIKAIELVDKEVLGPLMQFMEDHFPNNYRIAVLPDHYTFVHDGKHGSQDIPYAVYGKDVHVDSVQKYSERDIEAGHIAEKKHVVKSFEFMGKFLSKEME
jgi:2,3-bisphosphoglycerate-independent phosphoglycerate mutase